MVLAKLFSMFLAGVAALSFLLAAPSGSLVDYTISNGLEIERQFYEAEGAVDAFFAQHGRLPGQTEFEMLAPDGKYRVELVPCGLADVGFDCSGEFTNVRDGDYVLSTWRGEWTEYYRPSLKLSTVATSRSDFTLLGSVWLDKLFFSLFGAACAALAIWFWTRRRATF